MVIANYKDGEMPVLGFEVIAADTIYMQKRTISIIEDAVGPTHRKLEKRTVNRLVEN